MPTAPHVIGAKIVTPRGILGHSSLWKPRASRYNPDKSEFFAQVGFSQAALDSETGRALLADMAQEGREQYHGLAYHNPLRRDVDRKIWRPGSVAAFFKAQSGPGFPPSFWRWQGADKNPTQIEAAGGEFYAGCAVRLTFKMFAYSFAGDIGMSCSLVSALWMGDGERLRQVSDGSEYGNLADDLDDDIDPLS